MEIFKFEQQKDKYRPFTLGTFLDSTRNDTGPIYVSVVERRTKRATEAYISTERSKQKIWDTFKPEARIVDINFLAQAVPSMRIFVEE